jgi:hypothetical protein
MTVGPIGALVDLSAPGTYIHLGFIQISEANLLLIGAMVIAFALAIALPLPHRRRR